MMLKSIVLVQRIQGKKTQPGELNYLNLIKYYMLYNLAWLHKHLAFIKFVSFNRHL